MSLKIPPIEERGALSVWIPIEHEHYVLFMRGEMDAWAEANDIMFYCRFETFSEQYIVCLKNDEDATLFKLKWC